MKFNTNSLSARLYKSFYSTSILPINFCPYARKLILAWLLAIPFFILTLPPRIVGMYDEYIDKNNTVLGLAVWVMLFFVYCILSVVSLFFTKPEPGTFLFSTVVIGTVLIFAISILLFMRISGKIVYKIHEKRDMKLFKKSSVIKDSSVIKEFIKANKNKLCPRIEWYDNKNKK